MVQLEIVPHRFAPLFSGPDWGTVLKQVASDAESGHFTTGDTFRSVFAQAGFVSLWFFLKYIAGSSGPYDLLNEDLHMEMCNFRQALLEPGCRGAMFIPRGHYKDLSTDTPILTANRGWTTHGNIKVGDKVFSHTGVPVAVLAISERFLSHEGYRITFSDGAMIECGKTHLWRVVRHKRIRPYLGRLPGTYKYKIGSISFREEAVVEAKDLQIGDDIGVLTDALIYPEAKLPIPPYMLGVWLGDGDSASPRITCSKQDREIIDRIVNLGCKHKVYEYARSPSVYRLSLLGLSGTFKSLGLLRNKHIPEIYKTSSQSQRMELLRGLMDTDGHAGGGKNQNTATFTNVNQRLVEDVYNLAISLALRPRMRKYQTTYKNKPYEFYQVSFQHFQDRNPFHLWRKHILAKKPSLHRGYRGIRQIELITLAESSCLSVEGDMYLAGKELIPTHNSTIVTEGGPAWELLRSPWLRIRITNAIAEKAQDFLKSVKAVYDSNGFFAWLYGRPKGSTSPWGNYCPSAKHGEGWNDNVITLPNRGRKYREASVEYGGVGGASEGHHYDLHIVDDMIGLAALNSVQGSNAVMMSTKNWFWASEKSLLVSMRTSRVIVVGTRYAVDDVYDSILARARTNEGYPLRDFKPNPKASWRVYYRKGIEDGRIIFPENFTSEAYIEMAEDDWWTYVTQYMNDPQEAGLAEFSSYKFKAVEADYDALTKEWFLEFLTPGAGGGEREKVMLRDCDVIIAVDPAATETYLTSRTSRSAVGVLVTDYKGRRTLLYLRAGYAPLSSVFDWIFEAGEKYKMYLRGTFLEQNGAFKLLSEPLKTEQTKRGIWISPRPYLAVGEKTARIRSTLQTELQKGNLYVVKEYLPMVEEERIAFPMSPRKDILDMISNGKINSYVPLSPEEIQKGKLSDEAFRKRTRNITGY